MTGHPFSSARIAGTFAANPPLSKREAAWLARQGVSDRAMHNPEPVRAAQVVWTDPDRFELAQHLAGDERASRVMLFLVTDAGEAVDHIAWQPRTGQLGSWRGYTWGLGQEEAFCPRITDHDGLHVWRTPLQWLQAGRRGIVIFRPRLAAELLADAGPLIAMDLEHGQELRQALQRPGPRILISAQARRAA
jgi:hypothetical protein